MSIDSSFEQQLHDLRQRVEGLEARMLHVPLSIPEPAVDPALEARAIAITRDLFPQVLGVEDNFDPQEPDRHWRVIYAAPHETPEDTQAAKLQWRRRMFDVFGPDDVWRFTICVIYSKP
jgi:hypothetical protein